MSVAPTQYFRLTFLYATSRAESNLKLQRFFNYFVRVIYRNYDGGSGTSVLL